jgi:hypothetical protein
MLARCKEDTSIYSPPTLSVSDALDVEDEEEEE